MTETFISTGSVCLLLGIYLSTFYTYEQYKRFSLSQFNIDKKGKDYTKEKVIVNKEKISSPE